MRMKSKGRSTLVGLKTKTRDSDEFRSVPKSINLPELPDEVWLRIIRSCDIRMEWNAIEAEQRDSQELLLSIAKTCSVSTRHGSCLLWQLALDSSVSKSQGRRKEGGAILHS